MRYIPFLQQVHEKLAPETYLEIGVRTGTSLAVSRCRSVGVDPAYHIEAEINCDLTLFRTVSDEYFTRPNPLEPTGGRPFDLAFIDGLHLFEYALRDFINTERCCSAKSVIVFDDILPRTVDEAARVKHTVAWTGDVYPIIPVLAKYRPEVTVIPVNTQPTGLLLVMGLDPQDTTLADRYTEIMAEFRKPDPQPVPPELMDRRYVVPAQRLLESNFWTLLREADRDASPAEIRAALAAELGTSLGRAFTGTASQAA